MDGANTAPKIKFCIFVTSCQFFVLEKKSFEDLLVLSLHIVTPYFYLVRSLETVSFVRSSLSWKQFRYLNKSFLQHGRVKRSSTHMFSWQNSSPSVDKTW